MVSTEASWWNILWLKIYTRYSQIHLWNNITILFHKRNYIITLFVCLIILLICFSSYVVSNPNGTTSYFKQSRCQFTHNLRTLYASDLSLFEENKLYLKAGHCDLLENNIFEFHVHYGSMMIVSAMT